MKLVLPLAAALVVLTLQMAFGLGGVALFLFAVAPPSAVLTTWLGGRGVGITTAALTSLIVSMLIPDDEAVFGLSLRSVFLTVAFGQLLLTVLLASWMRDALRDADRARVVAQRAAAQAEDQLAMATHELRTPLTSLCAYARLVTAQLRSDPRKAAEANEMVVHEAQQATRLITKLLDSSAARRGATVIDRERVDLGEVARAALGTVRPAAEGRQFRSLMSTNAPVLGDATRLEELLVNLLENALKYSPKGTPIELSVMLEGGQVVARVRDKGPGIPAADRSRIFERFVRVPRGTSSGLGVGLYLAREIARAHGGDLLIESADGEGSTFALRLPRAEYNDDPARRSDRGRTPRRILLIEDDEGARQAVEALLSFAGHECRAASTSADALAIAQAWQPDVILLDQLRNAEPEFASTYRARQQRPAPILALTAAWDADAWARSIGAVAVVPKPFEADELLGTIERYALRSDERSVASARLAS